MFGNFFGSAAPGSSGGIVHNGPVGAAQIANPQPAAAPQPDNTGNPAGTPAASAPPASPLDAFNDLWQTRTTSDGKPIAPAVDPLTQPVFSLDSAKVLASAKQIDYLAGIPPENVTSALGGDVQAFMNVINGAIANAVAGVTVSQGNTINQALLANNQRVSSVLPDHIKRAQLHSNVEENPVFSHPAVAPLTKTLKEFALAQNPNASVSEIDTKIKGYLSGLATALNEQSPAAQQQRKAAAKQETDFSAFF